MTRRAAAGWTLVEVLIVFVILGLLATIAIPKFSSSRDKALIATMKSDLRNLATQEEAWLADSGRYTDSLPPSVWRPSAGVTGPTITLTGDGWTASVGHTSAPTRVCAIFVGSTALPPATKEGNPACTP